jgi:6,7-dimethyl-8-ribityllumazine synthase
MDDEPAELKEAEREIEELEQESRDPAAGAEPATEVPSFDQEEREALSRMEFAICVGRFYSELAERLANGAIEGFADGDVSAASVHTHGVPGAFELPLAAKLCADSGRYAGIACLGVVVRGETDHYDYVCGEAARGIQQVAIETGVPCAFGVITCDTMEQALARSGGDKRDQGRGAALTVMRMALMARELA